MSRYDLQPKLDQHDVVRAAVGWDRPLQTFFAQVFFRTEEESVDGEALVWIDTEPGELLTADAAIALVAPHVEIPAELADQLTSDIGEVPASRTGTIKPQSNARSSARSTDKFLK